MKNYTVHGFAGLGNRTISGETIIEAITATEAPLAHTGAMGEPRTRHVWIYASPDDLPEPVIHKIKT